MAEGRGKAQADNLRKARRDVSAKKLREADFNQQLDRSSAGPPAFEALAVEEAGAEGTAALPSQRHGGG